MAKKSLKRGLALGALMAFVITGSAMASTKGQIVGSDASVTINGKYDIGIYNDTENAIDFNGKEIVVDVLPGTDWKAGNVGVAAYPNSSSPSIINLGKTGLTDTVSINVVDDNTTLQNQIAIGLWTKGSSSDGKTPNANGGVINVKGNNLTIIGSSKIGYIYGISAQGNSMTTNNFGRATINIDAENTYINVSSDVQDKAIGIVGMSMGIVNIASNLTVQADKAIVARGGAEVNINTDGKHTTVLNGDIEFNYDGPTSGTPIDAKVNVRLSGSESYWKGNSKVGWNKLTQAKYVDKNSLLNVEGFSVTLEDGAKWIVTAPVKEEETSDTDSTHGTVYSGHRYLGINTLTMNNGGKVQNNAEGQAVIVENLKGSGAIFDLNGGGCIKVANFANDDVTVDSGTLNLTADTTITGKVSLKNGADIAVGSINEKAELVDGKNLTLASTAKLSIDDLTNYKEYAAIEAGKVTAQKGASVSIGAAEEGTYTIVKAKEVDNQMTDEDVTFDGGLKTGTWINSDTEMNLKVAIKNLEEETALVPTENASLVETALKNIGTLKNNDNTKEIGDFFDKISQLAELANTGSRDVTPPQVKAAIASSVQSGTNNGAASTAASVVNNVSSITNNRMSIVTPAPKGGSGVGLFAEESGAGVWAQYLHGKDKAEDMPSGSSKTQYKNSYNGILVGADFKKVDKFQSGIAFSYTDGDGSNSSTTGGTLGSTGHTDFKSYGVTYYGSIKNDTTNTMFDIGYNHSKADSDTNILLTGHTDSSTSKTNTWSAGVTVEKSYTDGSNGAQFIPYVGVRYMNINTDDFTTKMGYHNAMDDQNVFLIPVGIKFRQENVYKNGWKVTPKADLSYVWATGDTDSNVNVTIPGMPSSASTIGYTVMDDGSFLGTVGVEAEKGNWTYGLSYSYQKGEYQRSDKWFVDVRYSF